MDYQALGFKIGKAITGPKAKKAFVIALGLGVGLIAMSALEKTSKTVVNSEYLSYQDRIAAESPEANKEFLLNSFNDCVEIKFKPADICYNEIMDNLSVTK